MNALQTVLSAVVLTATGVSAQAQTDSLTHHAADRQEVLATTKIVTVGGESKATPAEEKSLMELFYMDQFRQFHDPDAPTFMLMSSDASLALGIGGKGMLRGWADWKGYQDGCEFFPYDIAIPSNPADRRGLGATMAKTSVFMTVLGRTPKGLHYQFYVQAGVSGKNFVLKKAYVALNDFTVGLAGTTFADDDALVPTVDAQGPNGQVGKSQILTRYFHTFPSGISLGAGVEIPSSAQDDIENQTEKCRDWVPDVAALVQYGKGDSHIRLSGILRTMTYRNLLTSTNHNVVGWGGQLSGVYNPVKPLYVYFTGVVGRGVGSYEGDLSEGEYDLVGVSGKPGKMEAPLSLGITAGLEYHFSRSLYACAGFGENRYLQRHRLSDEQYKYGLYGCVNLFWRITPRFLGGIEYVTGKRMNFTGDHGVQNRVDAMLSYSF